MDKHIDELLLNIPDLLSRNSLDLGSGRGRFSICLAKRGGKVTGVEPHEEYVRQSREIIEKENLAIEVIKGYAEALPFANETFDFINISEVIEHVIDPEKMLQEVQRILKPGGVVYLSVPNRFGFKDQHFGLHFVNWLPRSMSQVYISIFGRHKDYGSTAGLQRLDQMHYYTYKKISKKIKQVGFTVSDIREIKIEKKYKNKLLRIIVLLGYRLLRYFYFDSFHLLLKK